MRVPNGLRAFSHRDYRLYYTGQLISQAGTWMQSVAQSWLIVTLTHSAFKLGLISALQFLPTLLLALYSGALADRLPKRRTLVVTQTTMMLLAFIMAALVYSGHVQNWHVIMYTADTNTSLQVLVPDELRGRVISLYQLMFTGTTPKGALLTGAVIEHYNGSMGFLVDGGIGLVLATALVFWWLRSQRGAVPVEANVTG